MRVGSMLETRGIYSETPPDIRTMLDNNPTLLVSWWTTGFSLAIIVTRVVGRYVRTERFFPEDKVMMASLIPLLVRMAFVHVVLRWGTNNTKTKGLTEVDIYQREVGSKLVLAARIFYALFIWTAKYTVCEFLKRLTGMIWRRSLHIFLQFLYYFLTSTLIAVVIATLAECQPFDHYWQVVPDPGPQCRSGYTNLITMGVCDVITDLLLVAFPIPLILASHMPARRKAELVVLFALSLILVAITCYRVPTVIQHNGSQQYRSLLASLEILAATAVSNAVVIGSFVRDRGLKKPKFKQSVGSASVNESLGQSNVRRATITHHQWGSDSDLARDLGMRLAPELCSSDHQLPRPAPMADPYHPSTPPPAGTGTLNSKWSFRRPSNGTTDDEFTSSAGSLDLKVHPHEYLETNKIARKSSDDSCISPRRVSVFDVGGLLEPPSSSTITNTNTNANANTHLQPPHHSNRTSPLPTHHENQASLQDVGGLLSDAPTPNPNPTPRIQRSPSVPQIPNQTPFPRGALRHYSSNPTRRRESNVRFSAAPDSRSNSNSKSNGAQSDR